MIVLYLALIALTTLIIWRASDGFEAASHYLGRHLSDGVRGATINAIGSSLPELLTVSIGLLLYLDKDGFGIGVGTTAGSAIFNSAIIPAVVIIALFAAKLASAIRVSKKTVLRDGIWLFIAQIVFIVLVANGTLMWWHGLILILVYCLYILYMFRTMSPSELQPHEEAADVMVEETDLPPPPSRLVAWLTLDLEYAIFGSRTMDSSAKAWLLLGVAVVVIAVACGLLVEAVVGTGEALHIEPYFVAVILAAAATSVPDTILSVRDARNGHYDDALANALGSNIFDITVCFGLPLMLFGLIYGEAISLNPVSVGPIMELLVLLLLCNGAAFCLFYFGATMGYSKAWALLGIYGFFVLYVIASAFSIEPAPTVGAFFQWLVAPLRGDVGA